jgi:hypothetical protein
MSLPILREVNSYWLIGALACFFLCCEELVYTVEEVEAKKNFPFGDVGLAPPSRALLAPAVTWASYRSEDSLLLQFVTEIKTSRRLSYFKGYGNREVELDS